MSGKTLGQGEPNTSKNRHLSTVADKNAVGSSMGYGNDSDGQSSITKSGINTQNTQITDEAKQIQLTGKTAEQTKASIHTDTTTNTAQTHSGHLKNVFDRERVESELNLQRTVSQQFSQTSQQINGEINKHLDGLKEQLDKGEISQTDYDEQVRNWQRGQVLLNSIAAGLSAPTQSVAGIAAATASPALSYQIGQYFKGKNAEGTGTHILAHAILGAAVAAAGDNHALAGAVSAGGAEVAAPKISDWLYGTHDPEKMTAEQKETVTNITQLLGAATGALVGQSPADMASGGLLASNAVENNSLVPATAEDYLAKLRPLLNQTDAASIRARNAILAQMRQTSLTYRNVLRTPYANGVSDHEKSRVMGFMTQLVEAQVLYQNKANESQQRGNAAEAMIYTQLRDEAADDYRMLVDLLHIQPRRSVINNNPSVQFSENWNDGRHSAGFGRAKPPHYMEYSGSIGPITTDLIVPNSPYLKPYVGISISANPVTYLQPFSAGGSITMGWIRGHHHNNDHYINTGRFLQGWTASFQTCRQILCGGIDYPLIGNKARINSFELGVGSSGDSSSIGYTFDLFDNQSIINKELERMGR